LGENWCESLRRYLTGSSLREKNAPCRGCAVATKGATLAGIETASERGSHARRRRSLLNGIRLQRYRYTDATGTASAQAWR
jgi:hypothetical protein